MRFIIIIPFYNAKDFLRECSDSILSQTYPNWLAVFADDHSEDGSSAVIPEDDRIVKMYNKSRVTALPNIARAILQSGIEYFDDDVICLVDGDDKLLRPDALEIVANLYRANPRCLLTYGQYVNSTGGAGSNLFYTREEFEDLRNKGFRIKHLQTFKWKLFKEFLKQDPDLQAYKDANGRFFTMAYDVAILFPLAEIAGYPNIAVNPIPVYWYRVYDKNDEAIDKSGQNLISLQIRAKPRFNPTFLPFYYRLYLYFYRSIRNFYRQIKRA